MTLSEYELGWWDAKVAHVAPAAHAAVRAMVTEILATRQSLVIPDVSHHTTIDSSTNTRMVIAGPITARGIACARAHLDVLAEIAAEDEARATAVQSAPPAKEPTP